MLSRVGLVAVPVVLAVVLAVAPMAHARGLDLGFFDPNMKVSTAPTVFDQVRSVGGTVERINVRWVDAAPATRPVDFRPSDPDDPRYRWGTTDALVREAAARNLTILLTLDVAPSWAEGPGRPAGVFPGTWRPDAREFEAFASAVATRYSGSHADPQQQGAMLPRVAYWQAWNEPNLDRYLAPQWVKVGDGFKIESPRVYRSLANGLYRAVKKIRSNNQVVLAGMGPYGDPQPGARRVMPARYLRELFCLSPTLARRPCGEATRFDILDHHPYGIRGPFSPALNDDDASVPDIRKLTRIVRAAVKAGHARPYRSKRAWVTEISWDSSPPDPDGVPEMRQAQWLQQSLYVLWQQKVDTVLWFQVRDELPNPSYAATYQSGVLFADGTPKLAATAFRFPFVVRPSGKRSLVWGRSPGVGTLIIERKTGATWREVARRPVGVGTVFTKRIAIRRGTLRARVAGQTSLPAPVR
jgi:hypothetical protein